MTLKFTRLEDVSTMEAAFFCWSKEMLEDELSQDDVVNRTVNDDVIETVNMSQSNVYQLQAELVRASQSNISHLSASEVEVQMGVVMDAIAKNITAHQAIVGAAHGDNIKINQSNAILINASELTLDNSNSIVLYSQKVTQSNSRTNFLVARDINTNGGPLRSTIVIAGRVNGPVEAMFDTPRAALAGLVAGAAIGTVLFVGKFLFKKPK